MKRAIRASAASSTGLRAVRSHRPDIWRYKIADYRGVYRVRAARRGTSRCHYSPIAEAF
jgi:hypothetical protein